MLNYRGFVCALVNHAYKELFLKVGEFSGVPYGQHYHKCKRCGYRCLKHSACRWVITELERKERHNKKLHNLGMDDYIKEIEKEPF